MATEGEAAPAPLEELEAWTGAADDELEGDVVEMAEDDEDDEESDDHDGAAKEDVEDDR